MSTESKEKSGTGTARADGSPQKYWIQFCAALVTYLTVGMTVLSLISGPSVWRPPVVLGTVCLAFAIFARWWWGWRGFLTGALSAIAIVGTMQLLLLWFMKEFW